MKFKLIPWKKMTRDSDGSTYYMPSQFTQYFVDSQGNAYRETGITHGGHEAIDMFTTTYSYRNLITRKYIKITKDQRIEKLIPAIRCPHLPESANGETEFSMIIMEDTYPDLAQKVAGLYGIKIELFTYYHQFQYEKRYRQYDMALVDLFMPIHPTTERFPIAGYGLAAAISFQEKGIFTRIVTDTDHHGPNTQVYCSIQRSLKMPEFIDNVNKSTLEGWKDIFNKAIIEWEDHYGFADDHVGIAE